MLDPNKSALLERVGAFVAVSIVLMVAATLALPYVGAYFKIELTESSLALQQQVVGVITNVFMLIVGYFFGSSKRESQQGDTNKSLATTTAALAPAVAAMASASSGIQSDKPDVVIPPGGTATVAASESPDVN